LEASTSSAIKSTKSLLEKPFPLWKAQVLPAVRGIQFVELLEGIEKKPQEHKSQEKVLNLRLFPAGSSLHIFKLHFTNSAIYNAEQFFWVNYG
jgi:hypothetical protein